MANTSAIPSCAPPPSLVRWPSLVSRSVVAWGKITTCGPDALDPAREELQRYRTLDEFLLSSETRMMFWFFQRRSSFMSQTRFTKWSPNALDEYILFPAANGFVSRSECFFVSHFWRTQEDPDPDGEYLRLHQKELASQEWSCIWVDWTCMPQSPRSVAEKTYFCRCLPTMSGIIRNSGFAYFYPPFEPRLWILYELSEYILTSADPFPVTPDVETFIQHNQEMLQIGVKATLAKYNYRCSNGRDRQYLTAWLELLVLLRTVKLDIDLIRRIMDHMTWMRFTSTQHYYPRIHLRRFDGVLEVDGKVYTFTPFPPYIAENYFQTGDA